MQTLIYVWCGVALIGVVAGAAVLFDSVTFHSYLRRTRPELLVSYRMEMIRDSTMFLVHCLNLTVGLVSLFRPVSGSVTRATAISALSLAALLLVAISVVNYVIRHRGVGR